VRAHDAILDGEIVCLDPDGRSNFKNLLFRREWPFFVAFDVLECEGDDLRLLPLIERKRGLRRIMPRVESRLIFLDSIEKRGVDLFNAACERDLEGIVGKWKHGTYGPDGTSTSWVKMKNPIFANGTQARNVRDAKLGGSTPTADTAGTRAAVTNSFINNGATIR
jgi:bifunctional non-homologous end joining protein LigD